MSATVVYSGANALARYMEDMYNIEEGLEEGAISGADWEHDRHVERCENHLAGEYGDLRGVARSFERKYGRALRDALNDAGTRGVEAQRMRASEALGDQVFATERLADSAAHHAWWNAVDEDWVVEQFMARFPFAAEEMDCLFDQTRVEVGTIFESVSHAYQIDVRFYEVVKLSASRVTLRAIARRFIEPDVFNGYRFERAIPVPGEFAGEPFSRKTDASMFDGVVSVNITSLRGAHVWSGKSTGYLTP